MLEVAKPVDLTFLFLFATC